MREVYEQQLQTLMLLLEFACTRATARMRETTKKKRRDMSSAGIWMLRHTDWKNTPKSERLMM